MVELSRGSDSNAPVSPVASASRAFKPLSLASSAAPTSPTPGSPGPRRQLRAGRMSSISYSSPRTFSAEPARGKENQEPGEVKPRPLTLVEKHADLLSCIAQKEAKVNEARQELLRQEAELADLKRRWEQIITRPQQRPHSSSISSLPSNASSSSIASASTAQTSVESTSPEVGAVAQFSALVQHALGPDQPLISPAAVDTGKRLLGQLMRSVGGGEGEKRSTLDVVREEGETVKSPDSRTKRLSLVPGSSQPRTAARSPVVSPALESAGRYSDDGWTKRWDEVVGSDGFQSSKRATINFGSTLTDSIRSVLPTDLFPLPNLSPTPSPQPTQRPPPMPTQRLKPVRLREISSSRSFMDEGDSDGQAAASLPKPLSPARPPPLSKTRAAEETMDDSWEWPSVSEQTSSNNMVEFAAFKAQVSDVMRTLKTISDSCQEASSKGNYEEARGYDSSWYNACDKYVELQKACRTYEEQSHKGELENITKPLGEIVGTYNDAYWKSRASSQDSKLQQPEDHSNWHSQKYPPGLWGLAPLTRD